MNIVAVVPARGGSKGILRKNFRPFAGHPLLAWSILAAKQAELVDEVVVTSEDAEAAQIAEQYGAKFIWRPVDLAGDATPDLPVFQHALVALGGQVEMFVHLRPTAPLRPVGLIDKMISRLGTAAHASSVRTVVPAPHPPAKFWVKQKDGFIKPLLNLPDIKEAYNQPRQVLPAAYWHVGCVDCVWSRMIAIGTMSGTRVIPYELDPRYAIDIDTPEQWAYAEFLSNQLDDAIRP